MGVVRSPGADINGIDWLAQQNGGQFDPVLFGDYRDPQDNILNNTYGDFFNEAFHSPQDFNSPYNTGETTEGPQQPKHDLMKEIELQQNGGPEDAVSGQSSETISYDKLWSDSLCFENNTQTNRLAGAAWKAQRSIPVEETTLTSCVPSSKQKQDVLRLVLLLRARMWTKFLDPRKRTATTF